MKRVMNLIFGISLILDVILIGYAISDMKKPDAVARAGFCLDENRCG